MNGDMAAADGGPDQEKRDAALDALHTLRADLDAMMSRLGLQ